VGCVIVAVLAREGPTDQKAVGWAAVLSMVVGALGALAMDTTRRVLGFSIVSSIGYMILGLAMATPLALLGAGAMRRLTRSESLAGSGGLWRARPWFSLLFLFPALSLAGIPPFAGFWGKFLLAKATLDAGRGWLALAVLGVGLLTLIAMARIWNEVFWKAHPGGEAAVAARLPSAIWGPILALTLVVVGIGVLAGPFVELARAVCMGIVDPSGYIAAVLGKPAP
jgi:multicomponent Na+:H+ antiporter subunit D